MFIFLLCAGNIYQLIYSQNICNLFPLCVFFILGSKNCCVLKKQLMKNCAFCWFFLHMYITMHSSEKLKFGSSPCCHAVFITTNRNTALPRGYGSPFKFSVQSQLSISHRNLPPAFLPFTTLYFQARSRKQLKTFVTFVFLPSACLSACIGEVPNEGFLRNLRLGNFNKAS